MSGSAQIKCWRVFCGIRAIVARFRPDAAVSGLMLPFPA
jgi:hypothetical protein